MVLKVAAAAVAAPEAEVARGTKTAIRGAAMAAIKVRNLDFKNWRGLCKRGGAVSVKSGPPQNQKIRFGGPVFNNFIGLHAKWFVFCGTVKAFVCTLGI